MYSDLAEFSAVIFVYKDGSRKILAPMLKTRRAQRNAVSKAIDQAQDDPRVRAILSSAMSYDVFERLEKKAKGKTVNEVLDNWRKYWTSPLEGKLYAF